MRMSARYKEGGQRNDCENDSDSDASVGSSSSNSSSSSGERFIKKTVFKRPVKQASVVKEELADEEYRGYVKEDNGYTDKDKKHDNDNDNGNKSDNRNDNRNGGDTDEYLLWKERELRRLWRDRSERIEREGGLDG